MDELTDGWKQARTERTQKMRNEERDLKKVVENTPHCQRIISGVYAEEVGIGECKKKRLKNSFKS